MITWDPQCLGICFSFFFHHRDVVTFFSMEWPYKWVRAQTWGGSTICLLYINPYPAQNVGGAPGPLGDYIPALEYSAQFLMKVFYISHLKTWKNRDDFRNALYFIYVQNYKQLKSVYFFYIFINYSYHTALFYSI